jgi:hypothetical protein
MDILKLALLGSLRIALLGSLKVALFVYALFLSNTSFAGAVTEGIAMPTSNKRDASPLTAVVEKTS